LGYPLQKNSDGQAELFEARSSFNKLRPCGKFLKKRIARRTEPVRVVYLCSELPLTCLLPP
jgi:hypothetical protein